jgi:hypothetical protein
MGAHMPRRYGSESPPVRLRSAIEGEIISCAVRGMWNPRLERDTASQLRICLTAHPTGLIIDLSQLHDPDAESTRRWTAIRTAASVMDPPVHATLCLPAETLLAHRLQQLGTGRFLPVYPTTEQARIALTYRIPSSDRLLLRQTAGPETPGIARKLIAEACRALQKPHLLHSAQLVVSELVANATQTRTDIAVTVARRADSLRLTVSDHDPRLPGPSSLSAPPADEAGHGLQVVQAIASSWGAIATDSGKTMWAIIDREVFL